MASTASVRWKVDRRRQVKDVVLQTAVRALDDTGHFLGEESNRTIPIEDRTMAGTLKVRTSAQELRTYLGYDTAYAIRQHEDQSLHHDPGRRAKWLELTMREQIQHTLRFLAERLGVAFAGGGR